MRKPQLCGVVALGAGCKGNVALNSWPTWVEPAILREDMQTTAIPEEGPAFRALDAFWGHGFPSGLSSFAPQLKT